MSRKSRIGLIDIDGNNFPNLALMKISAFHKKKGDQVSFANCFEKYDLIYKSKVFTFTPDDNYYYQADEIIKGGTGYDTKTILPKEIDDIFPDYNLYNCQHAYGFLTRGCIRKCSFCVVPKKEGMIRPDKDIEEIIGEHKSAVLMDNNILALDYGLQQIEKIAKLKIKVDFNQGLDSRLITNETAKLLSKIKWLMPLRMACDSEDQIETVLRATDILRKHGVKREKYFIYVLVEDIESAKRRVEILKNYNLDPFAMALRKLDGTIVRDREITMFCRWVNRKQCFKSVKWEDFDNR
jgi:hypothetical protein